MQGSRQETTRLVQAIGLASRLFYDWTEGQMALGEIVVRQSSDGYQDADILVNASNVLRPNAVIGGIVSTPTVDVSPTISITYQPGQIVMGSRWNRYGKPPGEPIA